VAPGTTVGVVSEQISQRELRNDSDRILRALGNGKTFVVTRGGRPVGDLRPLRRDRFIDAVAVVEVFRNAPAVNWKQIHDDLDVLVDQDVTPHA
jgi:antitoxin (DNA-binding transcriptional repressor) of toxin-antitoxin stability system